MGKPCGSKLKPKALKDVLTMARGPRSQ